MKSVSSYWYRRLDLMDLGKQKGEIERGLAPPLVEGERPVHPLLWNLMIVFG